MRVRKFHRRARARRGIATLEFAMSLPILLALFVTIVWLGASLIGQSEVTVQARHKTWVERFNDGPGEGRPLSLSPIKSDNLIERDAETTVDISPLFAGMSPPKANHAIIGGSWDHRQIDMNQPPNWNLYTRVGGSAAGSWVQGLLSDLAGLSTFDADKDAISSIPQLNAVDAMKGFLPSD